MNGRELLEAMSFIDDALVQESEGSRKQLPWRRWASLAACVCVLILGSLVYTQGANKSAKTEGIPETSPAMAAGSIAQAAPEAAPEEEPRENPFTDSAGPGQVTEDAASALIRLENAEGSDITATVLAYGAAPVEPAKVTLLLPEDFEGALIPGALYTVEVLSWEENTLRIGSIIPYQEDAS